MMTTRPRLRVGGHLLPGLLAVALFLVFLAMIASARFDDAVGFPEGESIVANIGFALLNIEGTIEFEGFLVALIAIAVVLDAALSGAVLLASRDEAGGDG